MPTEPTNGATAAPRESSGAGGPVRTVSFVSLGCPKNLVDSEKMLGLLAEDGLMPVSYDPSQDAAVALAGRADISASGSEQDGAGAQDADVDPADAVVINTCGFLESSKEESLHVIRSAVRAKEQGRVQRVIVAGCLVQRHRAKMLDWVPGIDAMIGVFDRDKVVEAVRGVKAERQTLGEASDQPRYWIAGSAMQAAKYRGLTTAGLTVNGKDGKGLGYWESDAARLRLTPRHYAYLRMSEGCNQKCAFCTIPSIRGKMRSKPAERVAEEARELVRDGAHELLLIGQDTTSYGDDVGVGLGQVEGTDPFRAGLPRLLKMVSDAMETEAGPNGWLRLMYAYPSNFTDEIVDAFAKLVERGRLLPYLDIPLQHASDRVLTQMRRHVQASQQRELMLKLRERVPGMAIRTTFITGFPGETQGDHEQLLEFIDEIGFDAVGVFQYSREEGTPAGKMDLDPDQHVPDDIKAERHAELMDLQQQIAFEQATYLAEQFDPADPNESGVRFDVLIDRVAPEREAAEEPGVRARGSAPLVVHAGRTYFQAPQIDATTYVATRQALSPGELVRCVIVGSDGYDLIAQPLTDVERKVSLPLA
ncbi:MAG: 30S ribosomal protein S12 methylthiotransferase RimO [Phycisphaerales bacterium]|nr:MAG: 30S ribosomal protein S12 methylthiotransferase RimO [Phycisphaerales bacterium]